MPSCKNNILNFALNTYSSRNAFIEILITNRITNNKFITIVINVSIYYIH